MHGRILLFTIAGIALAAPAGASASPLFFDLRDPFVETLDGGPTLSLTLEDLTATVSADSGVLNRTTSGFGVNAPGSGDDTDAIDGALVDEAVAIAFDSDVLLGGVEISALSRTDAGRLVLPGGTIDLDTPGFVSAGNALLLAGAAFRVAHVAGNGFSFDGFLATPRGSAPVPAPSTLLLVLSGALVMLRRQPVRRALSMSDNRSGGAHQA